MSKLLLLNFDVPQFFAALQQFRGLQRKEWELNQTGADRGIEAVLIQRCTRELATFALACLWLAAMPALKTESDQFMWSPQEVQHLV
jgi:hypothetical protein